MADALVTQLARALNLSPDAARYTLNHLVATLREQIEATGEAAVPGLGTFYEVDDRLSFTPEDALARAVNHRYAGLRPITASPAPSPRAPKLPEPEDPFAAESPSAAARVEMIEEPEIEETPDAEFQPIEAFIELDQPEPEDAADDAELTEAIEDIETEESVDQPELEESDADVAAEHEPLEASLPPYESPEPREEPIPEEPGPNEDSPLEDEAEPDALLAGTWASETTGEEHALSSMLDDEMEGADHSVAESDEEPELQAEPEDEFESDEVEAEEAEALAFDSAEDEPAFGETERDAADPEDEAELSEADLDAAALYRVGFDTTKFEEDEAEATARNETELDGIDPAVFEETPAMLAEDPPPVSAPEPPATHPAKPAESRPLAPAVAATAAAATAANSAKRKPAGRQRGGTARLVIGTVAVLLIGLVALLWFLSREPAGPTVAERRPVPADTVAALPPPADTTTSAVVPADTVAAAEPPPAPPPSSDPLRSTAGIDRAAGGFSWIVASEFSRAPAERRVAAFREQGFRTDVIAEEAGGRTRYRVALGQFGSTAEADRFRSTLPAGVPADTWLLRL